MRIVLACLLLAAQWALAQEVPPALRLPDGVRPLGYSAELSLRPQEGSFGGVIEIDVEVRRPTTMVWLSARFLKIENASIGQVNASVLPGGQDFVGLQTREPLQPGRTTIRLAYRGELSERDTVGAFRMREAGEWYVYTQLESIFARRVFPCFDEPGYKVPWQLTLVVPVGDIAVSNTPTLSETLEADGMKRVRFARTRPLPSYLIAFGVGPFDIVDAGKAGRKATPLRILTPKGQGPMARYAAQVTARILELSEEYTGIPHPYEKLDSLAVPKPGGAMENPGLITYASNLILARPQDETPRFKQAYAHVAAHEIAHLWFGDLVTHAWWDDLWLNESFATWMSDKTIERFEPAWQIRAKSVLDRDYVPLGSRGSNAQVWQLPICVRHEAGGGEKRACTLMKAEIAELPLGKSCPAWVAAEESRYYRAEYKGRADGRAVLRRTSIAATAAEIGDLAVLARNGALGLDVVLARLQPHAAQRSRDVAQSLIWTLADLRPLIGDALQPNWERWVGRLFGGQAKTLGLSARPQDSDDTLRLRGTLIDFLAADGNDPALHAQARQLALRWLGERAAIDGTMVETVLQAAARRGDRELFERLVAALAASSDRRERRSIYVALGSFSDPALARAALALLLDPAHDFREVSQVAWTMSNAPRGGALAYDFVKANFDALAARAPRDWPAFWPRFANNLCSEAGRADVEAFFRERAPRYPGGPRLLAQTLERITLCAAFKDRQQASLSAFLRRQ